MKSERINKRHEKLETSLSQQLVKYKHTWIQYRYWKYQIPRISISLEIFFSFSRLFFKIWYMKCPESADTVNDTKAVVDTIRVIYMAQASRFLRVIVLASECNWSHGFRNSRTVGGFCLSHRFSRAFFALALPWAEERYQNETWKKDRAKVDVATERSLSRMVLIEIQLPSKIPKILEMFRVAKRGWRKGLEKKRSYWKRKRCCG